MGYPVDLSVMDQASIIDRSHDRPEAEISRPNPEFDKQSSLLRAARLINVRTPRGRFLRQIIIEGQVAGEFSKDSPDMLTRAILACLDGMSRGPSSSEELKNEMPDANIILRMLRPDSRQG